jgi:peptide/nickel transport system substrate-binding protein
VDDLRAAGEWQVGYDETDWELADSRLPGRARARAATSWWLRRFGPGVAVAWALSAFACTASPAGTGAPSGTSAPASSREPVTLTIGVPQSRQLDPSRGAPAVAELLAFERLTTNSVDGRTRPRLLEGWTTSADGLTWELRVRSDVRFQDGTPLTAADVKRTFETAIANPAIRGLSVCLPNVSSVIASSDRNVAVSLTRRCSYLLDDFDRAVSRTGADGKTRIGTGAFSIATSTRDAIVLEANRSHYLGVPAIDRVVVKPFDALRTAWAEMMRGQVDFLWEVGPDTAEFLSDRSTVEVRSFVGYYAYALMLNTARPKLRTAQVRRALNLGVDRRAIVQQGLRGHGVPADGPVWPRYWARDGSASASAFDPAGAKALLREAGAQGLAFTCLVPANFSILERMALLVQQQLGSLGVRLTLESLPPDVFNRRIMTGEFDAVLIPVLGGPSATVYHRFWHSPGATPRWNFWGYRNPAVDAALDAALDAPLDGNGDDRFRGAIARFEAAVRDDPPGVFLAWNQTVQAVSRRFTLPRDSDGRDAIYVVNQWLLRPPGSPRP